MNFKIYGHPNIRGTHKNTLEFTKEDHLTLDGDCIIGVKADYNLKELVQLAKTGKKVLIKLSANGIKDSFTATLNPQFNDEKEIVIRLGEYASERTLAVRADKAAKHLDKRLIEHLKKEGEVEVQISEHQSVF